VPSEEAVRFARELLDSGLFLAVNDRDYPANEANSLLLALSEFGVQTTKSTKTRLPHAGALELLVGRRGT
jgi:hypothetical protein